LRWASWTETQAVGTGTLWYNDCSPSCASGHYHYVPGTKVTLSRPVRSATGRTVWSRILTEPQPPGYATGPYDGGPVPLPTQPD